MSKKTIYDLLEALDISADDLLLIGTADGERKVRAAVLLGEMSGVEFATLSDILEGTRTDVAVSPARGVDLVDAWETKPPAFASDQETIEGLIDNKAVPPTGVKAAIDEAMDGIEVEELWEDLLPPLGGVPRGHQGVAAGRFGDGHRASLVLAGSPDALREGYGVHAMYGGGDDFTELSVHSFDEDGEGTAGFTLAATPRGFFLTEDTGDAHHVGVHLSNLTEQDLDDPEKQDIVGMTPALTKALLPKPHTYKTISGAYALSADDDNVTILADGDDYEIDVSGLPDGARCWILGAGGGQNGAYSDGIEIVGGLFSYSEKYILKKSQLITVHAHDGDVYVSGGATKDHPN